MHSISESAAGTPANSTPMVAAPWARNFAPALALIFALAMAYGYEVFSFHLTLDEENFGEFSSAGYAQTWLAQGRWSMAALTLLIPSPVVPVVSTLLGVALTGLAFWFLCRRYFEMEPWAAMLTAALGATLPTLAFMFSFSTIAYGIGVGNLLLVAYYAGISSSKWLARAGGIVALACAVGIYDSFLVAGAALAVALICRRPRWPTIGGALASVGLAYALSKVGANVIQRLRGVASDSYTSQFLDISGFFSDPAGRTRQAVTSVLEVVTLSSERFGLHSPWLAVALLALVALALLGAVRVSGAVKKTITICAVVALLLMPVGVEAAASTPLLLRTQIYLPVVVVVLGGLAAAGMRFRTPRRKSIVGAVAGGAIVLAIVGQATISNRLFGASEMAYAQDQNLAFLIGMEKERLVGRGVTENIPIVISGTHAWPEALLVPDRETLGVSFFAGRGGLESLQYRDAAFLRSQGVAVRMATGDEAEGTDILLDAMPSYPASGWVAYQGGVLLINFGTPDVM